MTAEQYAVLAVAAVVSFGLSYLGAACGLVLGHLRLPLLVYALGNPIAGASTNLAVSGLGAVAGAWRHVRDGRVSGLLLLVMGVPSVLGSVLSVLFFSSVSLFWSHLLIGLMLVYSGFELLKRRNEADDAAAGGLPRRWVVPTEVAIGLALGGLAAATGLMLGTIRLPMMIRWLKVDPKVAVGTNMLVGCATAFSAAVTAWARGGVLDARALLILAPPTVLGSYFGAMLTARISKAALKALVGWTVACTGLFMAGQATQSKFRRAQLPPGVPPVPSVFDPLEETPNPLDPDPFDVTDDPPGETPDPDPQPPARLEPADG